MKVSRRFVRVFFLTWGCVLLLGAIGASLWDRTHPRFKASMMVEFKFLSLDARELLTKHAQANKAVFCIKPYDSHASRFGDLWGKLCRLIRERRNQQSPVGVFTFECISSSPSEAANLTNRLYIETKDETLAPDATEINRREMRQWLEATPKQRAERACFPDESIYCWEKATTEQARAIRTFHSIPFQGLMFCLGSVIAFMICGMGAGRKALPTS
jgi:hypothetical protein